MIGIGALSYFGYRLYIRILATELAQQQLLSSQEAERIREEAASAKLFAAQQEELSLARAELEKTKTEAGKTSAQVKTLSQALDDSKAAKEIVISSSDLSLYVTGVVQVVCIAGSNIISGSGSLYIFKETGAAVLTNYHVVDNADRCVVVMTSSGNTITGIFGLKGEIYTYNKETDEAILALGQSLSKSNVPIENYNYSLSTLSKCTSLLPVGTPVVIVGFPAYAKRDSTITIDTIGTVNSIYRTATNGIISGYDTSTKGDANYFVSAKIDNGNSGGIALAKDSNGICTLGLPTWLTVGNYETQGLVQNINNILPSAH